MSNRLFSGGDGLAPGSMEHEAYEIMMKSELHNGQGAYEIGNAGAAASGPSFGPFQYDVGANQDGRHLLESIAAEATDAQGHRIISAQELTSIKSHLYKPFNTFTEADRAVYAQMKPKLDAALSSDEGVRAVNADFVPGIQKKVTDMRAVVDGMTTEPNKTFVQNSDVAQLMIIDTKNQYGRAVNNGLKEFVNRTKDDPAMNMPGRTDGTTIKVEGEFGLDDMVRYKLETQYGQNDQGAKDVLRRISHCVEAAGVEKVKASLSAEDKAFFETGLEKYLKDHGRDTKILDDPELKALAELGGKDRHQKHSRVNDDMQNAHSLLREGSKGAEVKALQSELKALGYTDSRGRSLHPDGDFGPGTKAAVEKFQLANQLEDDGVAGPNTLKAIQKVVQSPKLTLADATHPGHGIYQQAQSAVHRLDAEHGRAPDQRSDNLAAAVAVAAQAKGMSGVDHVVLSQDAQRAFAIQGDLNSPHKSYAHVDITQSVNTSVAQSSAQWQQNAQQATQAQTAQAMQQAQNPQPAQPAMQR
ncbi:XVIPCD domain-containing protein [Rhodanobacter sp. BL-MT-08]